MLRGETNELKKYTQAQIKNKIKRKKFYIQVSNSLRKNIKTKHISLQDKEI